MSRPALIRMRGVCSTMALAVLAGAYSSVAAAQVAQRAQAAGERLTLRTAEGARAYVVATPDAAVSAATAVLVPWAGVNVADAPVQPSGYTLHARVVVQADPGVDVPVALKALLGAARVEPAAEDGLGLRGFWIAHAPSVREAGRLADALAADPRVRSATIDAERPRVDRTLPTDPNVAQQWYLSNAVTPAADLNVEPAWKAGFIGTGITVGVLEGGFDITHPDLAPNYHAAASQPDRGFSSHGTATAGLVGMAGNNGLFGAGVAYGGRIARLYYGTDVETADAFRFQPTLSQVKTNSWGPPDFGTLGAIAPVEAVGIEDAALTGRDGLGTVLTWAAGNGQGFNDRVDYDQYASNRYVIAVGAIDNLDRQATYSEPGSALMVVTPSSADFAGSGGSGVFSTAPFGGSTSSFGGTSSTAPMAAGVVALMLQARPALTYRDVQHVLIRSARRCSPMDAGWAQNGAGLWFNEKFGFGAIDAAAAVALAQTWTMRPPAIDYALPQITTGVVIPDNAPAGVSSSRVIKANLRVERAIVTFTAPHSNIGDLRVELVGPTGTRSLFADVRSDTTPGYTAWTFSSVRHWDEDASGTWTLEISDRRAGTVGTFEAWQLTLIGTPRACPADWNRSQTVSVQDIFDYLTDWFAGQADANNDGLTSVQDLFDLLTAYFAAGPNC